MSSTNKENDLGVVIDDKLSFKDHVAQQSTKATKIVELIRRSFDYQSEEIFVLLYKSLVRPILEYGHCICSLQRKDCVLK